ncbi:MAG TPA: DUF5106 domain-containing protein [Flavipsychrobacter sp.]|nr:DUF5106 domain-containing protein [Flavipsychrobacter sp.]
MKKIYLITFLCFLAHNLLAQDGYRIQVKLTDRKDSFVYLAHYYGKSFPVVYKSDSAKLDKKGNAVFEKKDKIVGGIYMILPSDRSSYFEILLNNGDEFSVTATMDSLKGNVYYKNSPANSEFLTYQNFIAQQAEKEKQLREELSHAKTKADSTRIFDQAKNIRNEMTAYRKNYITQHPTALLSSIFSAMQMPQVPEGPHYKTDGKTIDSNYAYHYYKTHYWDGFNFQDDRLIHTPILNARLEEFFNKVVVQQEDSVIKEADTLLQKMKGTTELFKYSLNWLSTNAQTSKIMGMDKVFVHLVDNYYMKGDATWLGQEDLNKYIDRAKKIAPNVINNPAPPFVADDAQKNELKLYDFKAKYTLLIFYSADCGHCKHELPLVDSAYKAELKAKGVRILAFNVEKNELQWREFITKHNLEAWTHVWDPNYKSRYWALYDTQTVPAIYLLDEEKIIRGKKLDHSNIGRVIDITEHKLGKK